MSGNSHHSFQNSLPNYSPAESPSDSPYRPRGATINYDSTSSGIEVYDHLDDLDALSSGSYQTRALHKKPEYETRRKMRKSSSFMMETHRGGIGDSKTTSKPSLRYKKRLGRQYRSSEDFSHHSPSLKDPFYNGGYSLEEEGGEMGYSYGGKIGRGGGGDRVCRKWLLTLQIRALQQQLENYVSGRAESEATQQRLREDKNMFQNRTMMLEEQVGELKRSHEEEMARLKQAHREEKQQLERDCREKLEQSRQQMRELEQSGHQYKLEVPRLSGQLELLKEDKQRLEDKIELRDSTISQYELRMAKLEEEKDRMLEAHERKLLALQNEQRQLLQDLESRVGHSRPNSRQSFRNTSRHLGGSLSVLTDSHDEYGGAANFSEVLQKCNQLTHENLKLQDKIHELESNYRVLESRKSAFCDNCHQLISNGGRLSVDSSSEKGGAPRGHGVMAGSSDSLDMLAYDPDAAAANSPLPTCSRTPPQHQNSSVANQLANTGQTNLGASQPSGLSLAAELAQVFNKPREINMNEVVKDALANNKSYETICLELKQQEQINSDLQNYLSRLLLLIMESYPEILEVK